MNTSTIVNTKRVLLSLIFFVLGSAWAFAQDSVPAKKPLVKNAFESGYFIADQTVVTPVPHTLELVLQHDFGTIQNHWTDLYGIWGSSNIRIGFNYTIIKNLQIGFGTTKVKLLQDFNLKWTFLHQREGGMPVTVGYFGNFAIDCRNKSVFGSNFNWTDRLSYFNQIMIARRFNSHISLQLGVAWVHYNTVDSTMKDSHVNSSMKNENLNIAGIGRYKFTPQTSLILSYSQPVLTYLNTPPWPNFGLGVEISTSTHCFQIFISSAQGLVPQETVMYNNNNPYNGAILFGFNITRLWTF
jgi:hypothetical protein